MSLATRRLTEAHRVSQTRIGARTVVAMRGIWDLLDPADVDATFDRWLTAALPLIDRQRRSSAQVAANYLDTFKRLTLGDSAKSVAVLELAPPTPAISSSLLVTGPLSIKRAMTRGVRFDMAAATAARASAAAGMRHAMQGGRDTISATLRDDPDATGWQRVASGNACKFCNLLDGKFHYASTADFPAHDGCSCSQEPVYNNQRRVSDLSLAARR